MIVTPLRTPVVTARMYTLVELLDGAIEKLEEGSIVAITSKVVALCEGSVVPRGSIEKDQLVAHEASRYLGREHSKFGLTFTITNDTLIPTAGIDESNGGGDYVLWPRNPQSSATAARNHLAERFGLQKIGVILTDSTCQPMRRGTSGIAIAQSGFHAAKNYVGSKDLFGHEYKVTYANLAGMLAAAAVATMGEGTERTPLAVISDLPFIDFAATAPDAAELEFLRITLEEDLFAPFLEAVDWQPGEDQATPQS